MQVAEENQTKKSIFDNLNPEQAEAVATIEGPLLVLAGAGTGKTRVLTTRIANILMSGNAFPSQIMAMTFTNKAAREMADRVNKIMTEQGITLNGNLWLGTFHSIFLRILRRHPELIGLKDNFTILNDDDQIRVLKTLIAENNIDEKRWPAKLLSAYISRLKDQGLPPEKASSAENVDFANGKLIQLYTAYQTRLRTLNAVDFGDLLMLPIGLFTNHPDVLAEYQRKFKFILVDEYQDTNIAQYVLLRLLAEQHKNICCVGDDDQSIYSWRGAEIANILKFEKDFPAANVIRLERNYRSTKPILATASKLISNNKGRLGKTLWTEDSVDAAKIKVVSLWDEKAEAQYIGSEIEALQQVKRHALKDMAILVRAGYQTRAFEECFLTMSIPYKVIGGLRFYERMEIRDAIAYLRLLVQTEDDLAFERIINTPKRGLGATTLEAIKDFSRANGISMYVAAERMLAENMFKPKAKEPLDKFFGNFNSWREALKAEVPHHEIAARILKESGYAQMWKAENTMEAEGRIENLNEFLTALEEFESLTEFLEHVSLVSDIDDLTQTDMVNIMTLHAAKGLEFNTVFLPGWEEGVFPSQKSIDEKGLAGLEEERRLAYVGITRARKILYICFAASRRIFGQWQTSIASRFVDELPKEHIEILSSGTNFRPQSSAVKTPNRDTFKELKDKYGTFFEKPAANFQTPSSSSFEKGTRVFHEKFGYGKILSVSGSHLTIHFDKAGNKTLVESFVKKV